MFVSFHFTFLTLIYAMSRLLLLLSSSASVRLFIVNVCWMNWMKLAWRFWMSRVGFRTRFVFNKIVIRIHKAFHMIFSSIELNYGLRFITSVQFRMLFTQQPSWKVLTLIHNLQYIWFNLHFYIFHFLILINLFNRSMLFLESWMGLLPLINPYLQSQLWEFIEINTPEVK